MSHARTLDVITPCYDYHFLRNLGFFTAVPLPPCYETTFYPGVRSYICLVGVEECTQTEHKLLGMSNYYQYLCCLIPCLPRPSRYALYTFGGYGFRPQDNIFDSDIVIEGPQSIALPGTDGTQLLNNSFNNPGIVKYSNSTGNVVRGNEGLENWVEDFNSTLVVLLEAPVCFNETDQHALAGLCEG